MRSRRGGKRKRRRRGGKLSRLTIDEERIVKGDEDDVVQDLILRPHVVRSRRQRWLTPDGRMVTAPLPAGIAGHFGAELRRFVLAQYHRGQAASGERRLHADRRPSLRLVRDHVLQEPAQLSFAARGQPRGLCGQRGGTRLYAQAPPLGAGDRSSGGGQREAGSPTRTPG